jgi:predicted RNA polymerase sigma factor
VRAKKTLTQKSIPFVVPRGLDLAARLSSVLEVIYLIFNEGYAATSGEEWMRASLCDEAVRLGTILAELDPREAEAHGLVALMEIQASRSKARVSATGEPILLLEQDRKLWDQSRIKRGLAALERAKTRTGARGSYLLQAEIAACHARARTAAETDWRQIVALYTELAQVTQSPVIELNRAVAVGMAYGPERALGLLEPLRSEPSLRNYHLLPSVRGDFLARLSRHTEAVEEFERAADLTRNEREKKFLMGRARASAESAGHKDL